MPADASPAAAVSASDLLERAVNECIITEDQASAIRALQTAANRPDQRRRVSVSAEVLGYLGSILVIAGAVSLVAQFWNELNTGVRVGVLGAAALLLWGVGALLDEAADAVRWRLRGVVWLLSAGAFAAFTAILTADGLSWEGEPVGVATGGSVAVFSSALWRLRNRPGQHLSTLAGGAVAIGAGAAWADGAAMVGLGLWSLGAVWLLFGLRNSLPPTTAALPLGAGLLLVGAGVSSGSWEDAGPVFGLVTSGGLLGLGTRRARFLLTGAGVVGLLFYVPATATQLFADTVGVPLSLLASGVLLLAGALYAFRHRTPAEDPAAEMPTEPR